MWFSRSKTVLPTADEALPGRHRRIPVADRHFVLGTPLDAPVPDGLEEIVFGLGCFWGAERKFWETDGVYVTEVGYAGGFTSNPSYEEVCSGRTGHTEAVRVVFDPSRVSVQQLLSVFWESHDPTQGMRQGNDRGTQYRSAIYPTTDAQLVAAKAGRDAYGQRLAAAGYSPVTTEILPGQAFYPAEDHHQQYLAKVPNGYCGLGGTGVSCPVGLAAAE
jgi:peptide-methionine (S)-S-oxide reductase